MNREFDPATLETNDGSNKNGAAIFLDSYETLEMIRDVNDDNYTFELTNRSQSLIHLDMKEDCQKNSQGCSLMLKRRYSYQIHHNDYGLIIDRFQ